VAHAARLGDDRLDEQRDLPFDLGRPLDAEAESQRHESEQHEAAGVAVVEARPVEQVGHSDLVGRQTVQNGGRHVVPGQPHERPGRGVVADGVDEDGVLGVLDVRQEREAERAAVEDQRLVGRLPVAVEPGDGGCAQAVVAAEEIAEAGRAGGRAYPCSSFLAKKR
jgi:hypothetical protein